MGLFRQTRKIIISGISLSIIYWLIHFFFSFFASVKSYTCNKIKDISFCYEHSASFRYSEFPSLKSIHS